MNAIITVCPFEDTEALADMTDSGIIEVEAAIEADIDQLNKKHPESKPIITRIDDNHFKAVTLAATAAIRHLICPQCKTRTLCAQASQ